MERMPLYLVRQTETTPLKMNTTTNITSYCDSITDARLTELLGEVPDGVQVKFYGHVRTKLEGYGMWRVSVELDINGATIQLGFSNNDEEFIQKLRGHEDYTAQEQDEALDIALVMAMDEDRNYLDEILNEADDDEENDKYTEMFDQATKATND
jgi:hypothetical protein